MENRESENFITKPGEALKGEQEQDVQKSGEITKGQLLNSEAQLFEAKSYLACDNVEMAPNYKTDEYTQ